MTTAQWLALEIAVGVAIGFTARTDGWRFAGFLMAGIALMYLLGGP
jgi:hypothetical protein